MDSITVRGVTYDVEHTNEHDWSHADVFTIDAFPGLEARVGYETEDASFADPRDCSNVGTMAVSYRGYDLGDEDISRIDFEVPCKACDQTGETYGPDNMIGGFLVRPPDCPVCEGTCYETVHPIDYFKRERGARVVLGLTVYEHSGITMRAGDVTLPWDTDRWDTSFVGFIFDTPETVAECLGDDATDEKIERALRQEVQTYAAFLEGDVTFWRVEDPETGFAEGCGGYVGERDYTESECRDMLASAIEARLDEIAERAEMAARGIPTVG